MGLSIEFPAIASYTGDDPRHINPVLVALIENLSPRQAPVLRIGGDSTDTAWVAARGARAVVSYDLTPGWLATTAALARTLRARMILGVNLAADLPTLAAAEARAYVGQLRPLARGAGDRQRAQRVRRDRSLPDAVGDDQSQAARL